MNTSRKILSSLAFAALVGLGAGCSDGGVSTTTGNNSVGSNVCAKSHVGTADAAVVLLTDSASPAFLQTAEAFVSSPDRAFASVVGPKAKAGIVAIAAYNAFGELQVVRIVNLHGVANDKLHRSKDAVVQAACLDAAAKSVHRAQGNLLRALEPGAELASAYAGRDGAAVVAFGLGRSNGDGFDVGRADLSVKGRKVVFEQLDRYGMVPNLDGLNTSIVLAAVGDGVRNGITESGIEAFAADLCNRVHAVSCTHPNIVMANREGDR
jgi:hypothetical protein